MRNEDDPGMRRIRVLRLPQVLQATGLKKTTIYALQARCEFPMRIRMSPSAVGWIEEQVQDWIRQRMAIPQSFDFKHHFGIRTFFDVCRTALRLSFRKDIKEAFERQSPSLEIWGGAWSSF